MSSVRSRSDSTNSRGYIETCRSLHKHPRTENNRQNEQSPKMALPTKDLFRQQKNRKLEKQSDDGPTKGKGKAKRSKSPEYEEYVSLDPLAPVPLSDSEESSDEEGELERAVSSIVDDPKSPEVVELSSDDMEMSPSPPPTKPSQPPPPPPTPSSEESTSGKNYKETVSYYSDFRGVV